MFKRTSSNLNMHTLFDDAHHLCGLRLPIDNKTLPPHPPRRPRPRPKRARRAAAPRQLSVSPLELASPWRSFSSDLRCCTCPSDM